MRKQGNTFLQKLCLKDMMKNTRLTEFPNDLPNECDRIIFLNYGAKKLAAFYVKDIESQSIRF